ncbi:MAG: AMP-binding protein [Myxococcota bacterium]|nr:AMP-binding protein [Myxococcota bacterium]
MIDFDAHHHTVLRLNPRMPREEATRAKKLVADGSPVPGLIWLMTSGTSGRFKLTGLSREAMLISAQAVSAHLEVTHRDRWLSALPDFHVGGLGIYARAHISGASVIAPFADQAWSPQVFVRAVTDHWTTLSALVPTQLFDLVSQGLKCPSSLRAIVIGGGALDGELYHRARTLGYPVLPSYGLTECASQVATAPLVSLNEQHFPEMNILSHVAVRVGTSNRLQLKSKALFTGYLFEADNGPVFEDPKKHGWFETEDRGKVVDDRLIVLGRDEKFLKISGESVDLNRLEITLETLRQQQGIKEDAVIIARTDPRRGHSLVLAAEQGLGLATATALCTAYNAVVMPFERITHVVLVLSIPRSALGKVQTNRLVKQIDPLAIQVIEGTVR